MIVQITHTNDDGKIDADFSVRVRNVRTAADAMAQARRVAIAPEAQDDPRYQVAISSRRD